MKFILALVLVALCSLPATAACNIINGQPFGDCSNVTVNRAQPVKLEVRTVQSVPDIIAGAVIFPWGALHLSGMSNGDIVVNAGGSLRVTGSVNGQILNKGGSVIVDGTADALVMFGGSAHISGMVGSISGTGTVTCEVGAIIGGHPHTGGVC